MQLNTIKPAAGSKHARKRVGRGIGCGSGKTAGRGHKGQTSRSGGFHKVGFEGGQMPLQRRLPKRGFTNIFATVYTTVKVSDLNRFEDGAVVDAQSLVEIGLLKKTLDGVKILGKGNLERKLTVIANAFSQSAKEKIEQAGGKAEVI